MLKEKHLWSAERAKSRGKREINPNRREIVFWKRPGEQVFGGTLVMGVVDLLGGGEKIGRDSNPTTRA